MNCRYSLAFLCCANILAGIIGFGLIIGGGQQIPSGLTTQESLALRGATDEQLSQAFQEKQQASYGFKLLLSGAGVFGVAALSSTGVIIKLFCCTQVEESAVAPVPAEAPGA
jgi:hypothetical protein